MVAEAVGTWPVAACSMSAQFEEAHGDIPARLVPGLPRLLAYLAIGYQRGGK